MARIISLICLLSLCVSAALAAPIEMVRPAPVAQHHAMDHEAGSGQHPARDAENLACGICILHCLPGEIVVAPQIVRAGAIRFGAYPQPGQRVPATAESDAPERPPKSGLV
jgi:hypothetical protein